MKRKRISCVCRCTPRKGIVGGNAQSLNILVEEGLEAMQKEENPRKQAHIGLELGDLCEHSGMAYTALRVWQKALECLVIKDYDWVYRPLNPAWMRFQDVVSEYEAVELGKRIDRLWRKLGHPEMADFAKQTRWEYKSMWIDKYWQALP